MTEWVRSPHCRSFAQRGMTILENISASVFYQEDIGDRRAKKADKMRFEVQGIH